MRKIIALDLGTKTGVATATSHNGKLTLDSVESFNFKSKTPVGVMVKALDVFGGLAAEHREAVFFYEEVKRHLGVHAAHRYGGLLGILQGCVGRYSSQPTIIGAGVKEVKRIVTGNGNASKELMVEHARAFLSMQKGFEDFEPSEDEADAVGLLVWADSTLDFY